MSLQKMSQTSRWLAMELIHLSLEFLWTDISLPPRLLSCCNCICLGGWNRRNSHETELDDCARSCVSLQALSKRIESCKRSVNFQADSPVVRFKHMERILDAS